MNNYHTGTNINTYENSIDAEEEAVAYSFQIPENYRIYVNCEFPFYKIMGYVDTKNEEECKKLYEKMFSQIYNCLPFEVTGYDCSYRDEGFYPEITDEIKNMDEIEIIEKIKEENISGDNVYFVFAIDKDGNELFTEML